jgi:RHS repeat-associated protein
MIGFNYDANGNLHQGSWSYDVENRLVSVDAGGGEQYMYDPSNKRVYKQNNRDQLSGGGETYYFYGLDGKVIGEYAVVWGDSGSTLQFNRITESAYFGGKKVLPAVVRDRLGSVRGNASPANRPFGENYTGANADAFATYYRDSSTQLDYADQRYYSSQYGRFNSPDRYKASGGAGDPGSWNRFAYVGGDPVNYRDRLGRERSLTGPCGKAMVNGVPQDEQCDDGDDTNLTCASALNFNPACPGTWPYPSPAPDPAQQAATGCTNWGCMPGALATAINALSTHQDCMNDFGDSYTRADNFNPIDIVRQVYRQGGSSVAGQSVSASFVSLLGAAAAVTIPIPGGGAVVTIDSASWGFWNTAGKYNDSYWQAILLLHELGHVYDNLKGSGGSAIKDDGGFGNAASEANTDRIRQDCFK